ncbi:hypothetical protein BD324DRAFT_615522 [Kockovaella imperatae]|uniref:Signal peptidase complex subunit 1 n=1 Tax=Kockovaella imperatae TaxID=4999 RepID=A0A1Y1UQS0_9TREE|nr:hypothetical protein BD324DRAFT_615522 [Kockovaella imperatae]ORX39917.1 hypothetical protein BD324DRAFT_615522 [Kockovaella imperatae]
MWHLSAASRLLFIPSTPRGHVQGVFLSRLAIEPMSAILPPAVLEWIEGTSIDPQSQDLISTASQIYLAILSAVCFIASYIAGSVLLSIEIFGAGLLLLVLLVSPPWSFLKRHPVKFLPARTKS